MTGPADPHRPFERDAFFEDPAIVGARWWNRQFDRDAAIARRTAIAAFLGIGILVVGGTGVAIASQYNPPRLQRAIDVQRRVGWDAGASGEAFVSNAVVSGKFALRACIVNFRTRLEDVEFLPELAARLGKELT